MKRFPLFGFMVAAVVGVAVVTAISAILLNSGAVIASATTGGVLFILLFSIVFRADRTIAKAYKQLRAQQENLEREIDERKRAEETIRHQAHHDALTGLPNRVLLMDRLTQALAQARRHEQIVALMFLDLDEFKVVNDTAGHELGDELLEAVADRIKPLLREGDTFARLGGDEFALLLPAVGHMDGIAEVARRILGSLREPHLLGGREFHVPTSIGISIFPNDGEDAETLLRNADIAMYRAKDGGKDRFQLFKPAMTIDLEERVTIENDLRAAMERDEFVLHYQPQVNFNTGRVVGVEALIRWQHPDRGLVAPMEFIPVAEAIGLIRPLGEWVLRTACAQAKAWQEAGLPPLRIAVNLAARQFQQPDLPEMVSKVLEEAGLAPQWLELEITESTAMRDAEFTTLALNRLKEMGVGVSIDDFGTGYSSLGYLKRFPVNEVKIDHSFVDDIISDPDDSAIVATIIGLARILNLRVVAEGVETAEQRTFLEEMECNDMQGFLFSKPVPAEEFEKILERSPSGAHRTPA